MASLPNVIDLTASDNESEAQTVAASSSLPNATIHAFLVPLQPIPMPRVRRGRGGSFYNPATNVIRQTRAFLVTMFQQRELTAPLFPANTPVALSLIFRRQRPHSHFVGHSRSCALRDDAPQEILLGTPDLDNLEKLIMDAATGILYHDDRQVFCKVSCKLWADAESPEGSTMVKIKSVAADADPSEYFQF